MNEKLWTCCLALDALEAPRALEPSYVTEMEKRSARTCTDDVWQLHRFAAPTASCAVCSACGLSPPPGAVVQKATQTMRRVGPSCAQDEALRCLDRYLTDIAAPTLSSRSRPQYLPTHLHPQERADGTLETSPNLRRTHDFAQHDYVFAAHQEETSRNVTVAIAHEDALHCILQDKIGLDLARKGRVSAALTPQSSC